MRSSASKIRRFRLSRKLIFAVAAVPSVIVALYAVLPPPVTPLMLIRAIQGDGLTRNWLPVTAVSPNLIKAVIASEDARFCEHSGFDFSALQQQVERWQQGQSVRGASTITMQTAKNILLWPGRDPIRKVLEAWLTPQIEVLWSKRRIMEIYLNIIETGPGLFGVEAAAQKYFGKSARSVDADEAALMAAVLPNPRRWSPAQPSRHIVWKAHRIQARMNALGSLTDCVLP